MALWNTGKKAYLMLANGRVFEGKSFGAEGSVIGEAVFTTSMVGYQEALTDSTYYGQVICQTFPLIGNYGINDEDYESAKVSAKGYVVREWCDAPSNFRSTGDIDSFMKKNNVVGIYDIDTRALTRMIRDEGVMNCIITTEDVYAKKDELLKAVSDYTITDAVKNTTSAEKKVYSYEHAKYDIALLDLGVKTSIRKALINLGCNVTVYPAFTSADEILSGNHDAIVYSNGGGIPAECSEIIDTIKKINERKMVSFGIDLGHTLMAMACGAEVSKLKHGHHGANQPVKSIDSGKTYVTTQNHNYTVNADSLPACIEISHTNGNDKSVEGLKYKDIPAMSIQFIPGVSGGPQNPALIYNEFLSMISKEVK